MASWGDVCATKGLLALLILACPACRLLSELSTSGAFRDSVDAPSTISSDGGGKKGTATSSVDASDAETWAEPRDAADGSPSTAAETSTPGDADIDAPVDYATEPEAGIYVSMETGPEVGTDVTINPPPGSTTAESSGTDSQTTQQTATEAQSGTGAGTASSTATTAPTATGTSTPTATSTLATTPTATATSTLTATVTSPPSGAGCGTATTSQSTTATHIVTAPPSATSTGTSSGSGSSTSTATKTASSTTTSSSETGTQTATVSVPVSSIALNKTTDHLAAGTTDGLSAAISPANATNQAVAWSTSNASVATVSASGVVSAVTAGTATITATTVDGGKTATCVVTVVVSVSGVSLSNSTLTIGVGQTVSLTATLAPSDATNQNLTWSTSNGKVATVSGTGHSVLVNAIGGGSATVTASSQDGNKTATCLVTVAMSAQWVRTPSGGNSTTTFTSVVADWSSNIYMAGAISGTGTFDFGNSVTAAGPYVGSNLLLVKFNTSGAAQWARTATVGPGASAFTSVATDTSGNVFAVGSIEGKDSFGFGNSVVASGAYAFGDNLVLVKYDDTGAAQWARTVTSSRGTSSYGAVAIDPSGDIHAAGALSGSSTFDLGSGIATAGPVSSGNNALLVKYNGAGATQWALTLVSGSGESAFNAVTTNAVGDIYVAGYMTGNLAFGFGNAVTATGTGSLNALLVRYDEHGIAQWARTSTSGSSSSDLTAVAVDAAGSVFVGGWFDGPGAGAFGALVSLTAAHTAGSNALLLKYDAGGAAQWGQTPVAASGLSQFASLALDSAGNLYAVGMLSGSGSYDFGNSMAVATPSSGNEVLLARYNPAGTCQSAQTASAEASFSGFSAVAADSMGNIYAAGSISGGDPVDFGNSITATGAYSGGYNAVVVKYR